MRRSCTRACAIVLLAALPAATFAAPPHGGGGSRGAAPAPRSAPAAPAPRAAAPAQGGFNFNRDTGRAPAPAPQRPQPAAVPQRQAPQPAQQRQAPQPAQRGAPASFPHARPAANGGGPYQSRFHGPIVRNPHGVPRNWGWNHGVVWSPAPIYWGGGFWGPWAIAAISTAVLFGAFVDYDNQVIYPSYQVQYDSPGAQLLADYGLQQTPCGPPDLVVIWGPGNAVICAYPNAMVAAGNYEVDPTTLTLTSESP